MNDPADGAPPPPPPPAVQVQAAVPIATHVTCPNCGYNLTGVPIGGRCPECSLMIGRGTIQNPNLPSSGEAVASMVLGIVSIVTCFGYGVLSVVCGPLAIYFARRARKRIKAEQFSASSSGLATAGYVTGIIGTVLGLIGVLFLVLIFVLPLLLALIAAGSGAGAGPGVTPGPVFSP